MSCNYYFEKWVKIFKKLDELIALDTEFQEIKAHDKTWCDAVLRLTGMLGRYIYVYNEIADCCHHNLQVQKAEYITAIITAVTARIMELKDQLRKLVGSEYQFMGRGLIDHKLTPDDIVLHDILPKIGRDENINKLVLESMHRAVHGKSYSASVMEVEEKISQKVNWWENDNDSEGTKEQVKKGIDMTAVYELEKKKELTFEMLETKKMATLIQAHERSRKLVLQLIHDRLKRQKWEKELNGTLRPPARQEIREKSARIIQYFFRAYFEIKRNRLKDCKREELLDIKLCVKLCKKDTSNDITEWKRYVEKFKEYEKEWNENFMKIKQKYIEKRKHIIEDDIRDEIMSWFRQWYDETSYIRDIPKEVDGGSILITKEEIPSPQEWLEEYNVYLEEKRAKKNKTAYEQKYQKLQAKKEKLMQKKIEHKQKKFEERMLKKMMKNPKFHPGYYYLQSKKMGQLIQAVEDYKKHWSNLDVYEEPDVKEKFVIDYDISNAYMEAKIELRKSVDVTMRENFKILHEALTEDYKQNGEEMPEEIKKRTKRKKKQRKHKIEVCEEISHKLEDLVRRGFLKEYPMLKIKEFIGDPNFAGDDLRCKLQASEAFSGETRALWWEKCRELSFGSHRTLLVGARGSGKTTLVHVLATMNDATLYEIDPAWVREELLSAVYLQELATSIADCARATQPSVIYIKHLHRLYYTKVPPEEDADNLNLIKRYLIRKLMKKIHKSDKVLIAASCIEPWLTRSKKMLKQFPNVILLPNTNYSTVTILLNNWILENHVIPRDLDVQSLARVLKGYSFAHIKDTLNKFLTADRIVKIAGYGLPLTDIYDYFLDSTEEKTDYNKYLKWYNDKTHWGKKGNKLLEDQKEFQLLVEKWQQKKEKKKKKINSMPSETSSNVDSKL